MYVVQLKKVVRIKKQQHTKTEYHNNVLKCVTPVRCTEHTVPAQMMARHTHWQWKQGPPRGFPVSGDCEVKASGL